MSIYVLIRIILILLYLPACLLVFWRLFSPPLVHVKTPGSCHACVAVASDRVGARILDFTIPNPDPLEPGLRMEHPDHPCIHATGARQRCSATNGFACPRASAFGSVFTSLVSVWFSSFWRWMNSSNPYTPICTVGTLLCRVRRGGRSGDSDCGCALTTSTDDLAHLLGSWSGSQRCRCPGHRTVSIPRNMRQFGFLAQRRMPDSRNRGIPGVPGHLAGANRRSGTAIRRRAET